MGRGRKRAMSLSIPIRRILLMMVFSAFIIFEMCLITAFLPAAWQRALSERLNIHDESYKQSVRTHPQLIQEIDQVLRENLRLRIAVNLAFGVLLTGNSFLIWRVWGCLRVKRTPA